MGEGRRAGTLHGLLAKINIINALKCHCQLLLSAAAAAAPPPAPAAAASAIKLPKNDASDGDNNDCWARSQGLLLGLGLCLRFAIGPIQLRQEQQVPLLLIQLRIRAIAAEA